MTDRVHDLIPLKAFHDIDALFLESNQDVTTIFYFHGLMHCAHV